MENGISYKNETVSHQPQISQVNMENYNQYQPPPPYSACSSQPQYVHTNSQVYYQQPVVQQPVYYVGAIEQYPIDPAAERLRIPAIVMAAISCFCGCWLFSIPAIILAVFAGRNERFGNARCYYITSIILSVIGIAITILIFVVIIVNVTNQINSASKKIAPYHE